MEGLCEIEEISGRFFGTRRSGPPGPPPLLPVLSVGSPSDASRDGVDGRGSLVGVGPWAPSVNDGPCPFYSGGV